MAAAAGIIARSDKRSRRAAARKILLPGLCHIRGGHFCGMEGAAVWGAAVQDFSVITQIIKMYLRPNPAGTGSFQESPSDQFSSELWPSDFWLLSRVTLIGV
jgi:hypothetical protein